MAKKERIDYQRFWRGVTRDGKNPCELRHAPCHACNGEGKIEKVDQQLTLLGTTEVMTACRRCNGSGRVKCSNVIDAHHFVPKRRLDTVQAAQDVRNGVTLCREHHDLVEAGILRSPRPELLAFFLSEHGVTPGKVPAAYGEEQHDEDLDVAA